MVVEITIHFSFEVIQFYKLDIEMLQSLISFGKCKHCKQVNFKRNDNNGTLCKRNSNLLQLYEHVRITVTITTRVLKQTCKEEI